ncbi:hypothetical protein BST97_09105 [Nonlabens spongiae]|uniref:Uncharacterized protein n=1 Tax=Nonlabens spongiae TaxID=331648 RepID=A0A1W6MKP8_9FLAO|nr:hypothetical protein BST97_09105 [Nonlabens spongiae]
MPGRSFDYILKDKRTYQKREFEEEIYTFKCSLNISYIVEVEYHYNYICILKFYQKNHRNSKHRYSLLNSRRFLERHKTSGTKNFLMILNTIIEISIGIFKKNDLFSFGFIGAPTKIELEENSNKTINPDGTVESTKRFNTYSIYVKRYFSPDRFEHIEIVSSSSYLIKSRKNLDLTTTKVEHFFKYYIENHC